MARRGLVGLLAATALIAAPALAVALQGDPVKLTLEAQPRAFVGYRFVTTLKAEGAANGAEAIVERRVGGSWREEGRGRVFRELAEAVIELPRGRQELRVRIDAAGQTVLSPVKVVDVLRARNWSTSREDDGAYSGKTEGGGKIKFKIARSGHQLRGFSTTVSTFCVGPTIGDNHIFIGVAPVSNAKIAPDGRFLTVVKSGRDTEVDLRGRLRRGRVTGGSVELTIGTCNGSTEFSARHSR